MSRNVKARALERLKIERMGVIAKAYLNGETSLNFQQGSGFRAAEAGLPESANPYHHRSKAYAWWRRGYDLGVLSITLKLINRR